MEIAKIQVSGTTARVLKRKPIPAGLIGGYITVEYGDSLWLGLTKTVVFRGAVTRDVVTAGNVVEIPAETIVAGKRLQVGFYGTRADGTLAVPTFWADLGVAAEAADPSGDESTDPSLPVWAQFADDLKKAVDLSAQASASSERAASSAAASASAAAAAEANANEAITAANQVGQEVDDRMDAFSIKCTETGSVISLDDSAKRLLQGLRIFGKTTQDGTPTLDAPVALESVGESGSIIVNIGITEADENLQELTVSTPDGLPGIPVTTGGNYTDENGQRWICDEVDFEKGVYVQRVDTRTLNGSEDWIEGHCTTEGISRYLILGDKTTDKSIVKRCSHFKSVGKSAYSAVEDGLYYGAEAYIFDFAVSTDKVADVSSWKSWLNSNPVEVHWQLATPIETALTKEELTAYAALHTNYPNTTIFNDGGAGMEVKYVADTKLYIDRKFDQLAAAMLNQ